MGAPIYMKRERNGLSLRLNSKERRLQRKWRIYSLAITTPIEVSNLIRRSVDEPTIDNRSEL